jgi:hypothetical protein
MWPAYRWLDSSPGPAPQNLTVPGTTSSSGTSGTSSTSSYGHWAQLGLESWEPDEQWKGCAAASFERIYSSAWAWQDEPCNSSMPFVCKLIGAWSARVKVDSLHAATMLPCYLQHMPA